MTLEILLYVSEFLMCKMVVITHVSGEGNGNPLQYSCLENPVDGGAWCPWGHKESDMTERLHFTGTYLSFKTVKIHFVYL